MIGVAMVMATVVVATLAMVMVMLAAASVFATIVLYPRDAYKEAALRDFSWLLRSLGTSARPVIPIVSMTLIMVARMAGRAKALLLGEGANTISI